MTTETHDEQRGTMQNWLYLSLAIVFEIVGTMANKLSDGMTRKGPTVVVVVCYVACFFLFSRAIRTIELGTAYAVWSGVGMAALAVIGATTFGDTVTPRKILSLLLIVAGVVGLNLGGGKAP
jgi:small multidrug resistance pump